MSENIEIEAKVLLSKEQYLNVISSLNLSFDSKISQTNYYIDTEDRFLKSIGNSLRIRQIDNSFDLTLKTHLGEGLLENHQLLAKEEFETFKNSNTFPKGEVSDILNVIGIDSNELIILASLQTDRIELSYQEGIIALDKNSYEGIIDYEIEAEASSMKKAEDIIREILYKANIKDFSFSEISKQRRAIDALRK